MTLLLLFNAPASSGATGTAFQSFVEAGMFLGNWDIDDYLTFTACTHDAGAAADADAVPSYAIYEDETATAIVSGNMAKLGAVTGFYTERVQLTAAAGFEAGKCYAVRVEAVMGGVTAAAAHSFAVKATSANVTYWAGNPVTSDQQLVLDYLFDMIDSVFGNRYFNVIALQQMPTAIGLAAANLDTQLAAVAKTGADGDTLETLSDQIDAIDGSYAGSGTGYYTDTIDDGTNPLDGVRVQLYTAPKRVGPAYEAYTNALGVFEMWPDPGVYYRWLDLAGYNFTQDVAVTVTES